MTKIPPNAPRPGQPQDDPPPILGSWTRLYVVVLVHLFAWIAIFYAFTREFDLTR